LLNRKPPEPEINVTPLVDVVLVLLIIFMVVAPALQEGEAVVLPEITKPDPKAKDSNPIEVTMALGGRAVLNDERMSMEKLWPRLEALHEQDAERRLRLKTDYRVPYKTVRESFARLQDMGFKGVSLKVETAKGADGTS
jgi:biopolymer transport protein ExbD/biopolymer transport protein TolR